jgi:hypothetical protein
MSLLRRISLTTLLALLVLSPRPARAAACCLSASVFGIGRLAVWERAAFGMLTLAGRDTGRWDKDGTWRAFPDGYRQDEVRSDLWGILRLHERVQAFGRLPWVAGIRSAEGVGQATGSGLGDAQVGGRWDVLLAGERAGVPAVALTATLTVPTARRAEEATDPLGASTTGRGAWFARLDVGVTVPAGFARQDLGKTQRYGTGVQLAVSAGRELVPDTVVLGAQVLLDREAPYTLNGNVEPASGTHGWNTGLSLSWKVAPAWTLTGNCATDAPAGWLGARNRTERWSAALGVRFGVVE